MRKAALLISLSILLICSSVQAKQLLNIEVFHDDNSIITNYRDLGKNTIVKIHNLSDASKLEDEISVGLSKDPVLAQKQAMQILKNGGKELQNRILAANTPALRALELDIKKLPAIVFNGNTVIYGETNVQAAYTLYKNNLKGQGN